MPRKFNFVFYIEDADTKERINSSAVLMEFTDEQVAVAELAVNHIERIKAANAAIDPKETDPEKIAKWKADISAAMDAKRMFGEECDALGIVVSRLSFNALTKTLAKGRPST